MNLAQLVFENLKFDPNGEDLTKVEQLYTACRVDMDKYLNHKDDVFTMCLKPMCIALGREASKFKSGTFTKLPAIDNPLTIYQAHEYENVHVRFMQVYKDFNSQGQYEPHVDLILDAELQPQ